MFAHKSAGGYCVILKTRLSAIHYRNQRLDLKTLFCLFNVFFSSFSLVNCYLFNRTWKQKLQQELLENIFLKGQNYWKLYSKLPSPLFLVSVVCDWELWVSTGTQLMSSSITGVLTLAKKRLKLQSQCGILASCPPICLLQWGHEWQGGKPPGCTPSPPSIPSRSRGRRVPWQPKFCRAGWKAVVPEHAFRGRQGNIWS